MLQFIELDEAVVEGDVLLHAQLRRQPLQFEAVELALGAQEVRVCHPENDVDQVWMLPGDLRQRAEHILEPYARR